MTGEKRDHRPEFPQGLLGCVTLPFITVGPLIHISPSWFGPRILPVSGSIIWDMFRREKQKKCRFKDWNREKQWSVGVKLEKNQLGAYSGTSWKRTFSTAETVSEWLIFFVSVFGLTNHFYWHGSQASVNKWQMSEYDPKTELLDWTRFTEKSIAVA